jgi:hypothetical protein
MTKKVHIVTELLPEASKTPFTQIEETIRNEAKIPWCNEIKEVTIEDIDESYKNLKNHGISSSVARNLMDLYTE